MKVIMQKRSLAIIIPAYKESFLAAALDSIAAQTCQDFTLYIGDDCSPYDLKSIVDRYRDKIHLVYKRFDTNMGGKDLVAQWERCVDMNQGEDWIWLFSDDDVMEPNCVEVFYMYIQQKPNAKLLHYNIKPIDGEGNIIATPTLFPEYLSAKQYLDGKLSIGNDVYISFVVEFIVHRDVFYSTGRFQNYALAWGSDMVSWVKFADAAGGIYTLPNACVRWRSSGLNISTDERPDTVYRKLLSVISYMQWILHFSQKRGYGRSYHYSKFALGEIMRNRKIIGKKNSIMLINEYWKSIKGYRLKIVLDCL